MVHELHRSTVEMTFDREHQCHKKSNGEHNAWTTYIEIAVLCLNEQRTVATIFWWRDAPRELGWMRH